MTEVLCDSFVGDSCTVMISCISPNAGSSDTPNTPRLWTWCVFFSVARGVVVKGNDQETLNAVKGTVLEQFKEDRNLLNMMGIANSSDQ